MLMLGITVSVTLSVVFPFWLITVLIIILFIGTSLRSFFKEMDMWRAETLLKQILCLNLRWKRILVLLVVWGSFLLIGVIKNDVEVCSVWWVLFSLQFPIAFLLFGYEALKLHKEHKKRMSTGNIEYTCEASIEWTSMHLAFCALCGIVGGILPNY